LGVAAGARITTEHSPAATTVSYHASRPVAAVTLLILLALGLATGAAAGAAAAARRIPRYSGRRRQADGAAREAE
jgi:uncharacterized protein HemX